MYTHFRKKNVLDKSNTPGIAECFGKCMEYRPQGISRALLISGPPARFRGCPLLCVRESQTNAVRAKYNIEIRE